VHSIITYGIIFSGNSPYSINIFRIQKRVIRIITYAKPRDSCRELFKDLKILPLYSQYIFSLSLFVVNNNDQYKSNQEIHSFNTRYTTNLHLPTSNLAVFQSGTYYSGIRVSNHLPSSIQSLSNVVKLFNPLLLLFKALLHGRKTTFLQWAFKFTFYTRNRSPLQKKIITIKVKKTEW
jgi:hypothetical protein